MKDLEDLQKPLSTEVDVSQDFITARKSVTYSQSFQTTQVAAGKTRTASNWISLQIRVDHSNLAHPSGKFES